MVEVSEMYMYTLMKRILFSIYMFDTIGIGSARCSRMNFQIEQIALQYMAKESTGPKNDQLQLPAGKSDVQSFSTISCTVRHTLAEFRHPIK